MSLAAFLLYRTLSRYSFEELIASVAAVPTSWLAAAGGFAAASYLCLTGFDFLALRYVPESRAAMAGARPGARRGLQHRLPRAAILVAVGALPMLALVRRSDSGERRSGRRADFERVGANCKRSCTGRNPRW